MAFRSGWNGEFSSPNSAHMYIKAENSAGTISLGGLAGGSSSHYASVGLIEVINNSDDTEKLERNAQNSKVPIKVISGNRKLSFTVDAIIGNDVGQSLAHGVLAVYDSTPTDVPIPASPESIYGDVIIEFLSDEYSYESATCHSTHGIRMENCLIKSMGLSPTYDGKGQLVYRFEITPSKDEDGNLYTVLKPHVFDATADYLALSDFAAAT